MSWALILLIIAFFFALLWLAVVKAGRAARLRERQLWTGISRDIAHQMGTPLSALMGWMDILPSAKTVENILPEMQHDLERLRIILNRLSQVSAPSRFVPISLRQMTSELRSYFQKRLPSGERGVTITEEIAGDPQAQGQPDLLFWALEHLVKNAADALGGRAGSIILRAREEGDNVEIQIEDSGRGIQRKLLSKISAPGFTTKNGGRGLGLALAALIIEEQHQGKVIVKESIVGQGTTISVILPKAGPAPS
jgi:signal transduction histidine kinase